jgi:hypothetical protein
MRHVRRLRLSPSMVVACLALSVALGGTGYAAITLPKNSVGAKQLKKNAITSPKIKDRSLLARDFKQGQIPRGPKGDTGAQGAQGIQGIQGPAGPFPDGDMPAGKTLRGNWIANMTAVAAGDATFDTISFGFRLAVAPTAHLLAPGAPPTPECPGSLSAPEAASGHLCIYTYNNVNVQARFTCDPLTSVCSSSSTNRYGTTVRVDAAGAGESYSLGTWAVTS